MMSFFPSDAAAWARLRPTSSVGSGAASSETERKAAPRHDAEAGKAGEAGVPVTDRKVEVRAESPVTTALGRYGSRISEAIASGIFLKHGQSGMRVSTLGAHLEALLREHGQARSRDWLTPALQATARHHPSHRELALSQVLRPALSSTLTPASFQASLDSIIRSLAVADAPARRVTFSALVKLLAMPHRRPANALALLEAAHVIRKGIAYDDVALLVGAALRRIPDRPVPDLVPVARAALALLDKDNEVASDDEPIVNLGIELGRQAGGMAAPDNPLALLRGVESVAPGLRADQLWELARGCLGGLGGVQVDLAQRDAWLATVSRLDAVLAVPAYHAVWEGVALGLLVEGASSEGTGGTAGASQLRSAHMGALVAVVLGRPDDPMAAAALMTGAAGAANKLHDGPGTLGDLLQRVAAAQSRLPTPTAFAVGCALARGCSAIKDGMQAWDRARRAAGSGGASGPQGWPDKGGAPRLESKALSSSTTVADLPRRVPGPASLDDSEGAPAAGDDRGENDRLARDPVGTGWRFATDPYPLAGEDGLPASQRVELATLAWSLPGVPSHSALHHHLRWLALAPLTPSQRGTLAAHLLARIDARALRRLFPQVRDLLLNACRDADAEPGPKTGQRTVLLQAMNQLMLAYDQWLTEPDRLDRQAASAQQAEMAGRKDLPPELRLMILDRLAVHLSDTKA